MVKQRMKYLLSVYTWYVSLVPVWTKLQILHPTGQCVRYYMTCSRSLFILCPSCRPPISVLRDTRTIIRQTPRIRPSLLMLLSTVFFYRFFFSVLNSTRYDVYVRSLLLFVGDTIFSPRAFFPQPSVRLERRCLSGWEEEKYISPHSMTCGEKTLGQ